MAENRRAAALRLVTYTIHKGIGGVDRRYRPERIIEVLARCRADVLLLQEVDEGVLRSRRDRQVDLLGDALGFEHRAYFPNVRLKQGHYGNAVLSRFPLEHQENIDLSRPLKKRRGALHCRFTVPGLRGRTRVWLYNVHLGLGELERRAQLRKILDWHGHHRVHPSTVVVIGGDLNDVWQKLGSAVLEPGGFQGLARRPKTFPAVRPMRPLDTFFMRGPTEVSRLDRPHDRLAREASDHLPLALSLKFIRPPGK